MRVVRDPQELDAAIDAARRESGSAFGRDELFAERFVEHARHIEVQVASDRQGNVVHLGTRDCTVQRRHQKLIEEAPAIGLPDEVATGMVEGAVRLARDVDLLVDHGAAWIPRLVGLKVRATESARFVVDQALRVSGGSAIASSSELGRLYRDVIAGLFHPSDGESAHNTVANALLGPAPD